MRARESVGLSIEDALAALLAKNPDMPRGEPEVAASIGAQLEHMELTSMPTGLRRRIRDVISRVQPKRVCEVGWASVTSVHGCLIIGLKIRNLSTSI